MLSSFSSGRTLTPSKRPEVSTSNSSVFATVAGVTAGSAVNVTEAGAKE